VRNRRHLWDLVSHMRTTQTNANDTNDAKLGHQHAGSVSKCKCLRLASFSSLPSLASLVWGGLNPFDLFSNQTLSRVHDDAPHEVVGHAHEHTSHSVFDGGFGHRDRSGGRGHR